MKYDLHNRCESYSCHGETLDTLLRLASLGGWESEGTLLPIKLIRKQLQCDPDKSPEDLDRESLNIEESWYGMYRINYRQSVSDDNALNMAAALESTLFHIPLRCTDESIRLAQTVARKREGFTDVSTDDNPLINFAGPCDRAQVQNFIDFVKMGGFTISSAYHCSAQRLESS